MRVVFWLKRTLLVFTITFILLVAVELLKGHGLEAGLQFALVWSAIATAVFIGTRIFYVSRGKNCPLCNDLPQRSPGRAAPPNTCGIAMKPAWSSARSRIGSRVGVKSCVIVRY